MYLIIEEDFTITKSSVLSGHLRMRARQGYISLIDCRNMQGMNRATFDGEPDSDWSEIAEYKR